VEGGRSCAGLGRRGPDTRYKFQKIFILFLSLEIFNFIPKFYFMYMSSENAGRFLREVLNEEDEEEEKIKARQKSETFSRI
jgi:hypothetical protein